MVEYCNDHQQCRDQILDNQREITHVTKTAINNGIAISAIHRRVDQLHESMRNMVVMILTGSGIINGLSILVIFWMIQRIVGR